MSNVENIVQSIGEKEFNTGAATVAYIAQTLAQTERDKLLNAIQVMREGAAEHVDDFREQLNSAKGLLGGKDAAINRLDMIVEQQAETIRKYQDAETQHLFAIEQLKAELSKYTDPISEPVKPLVFGIGAEKPIEPGVYRVWVSYDVDFDERVKRYSKWDGGEWSAICSTASYALKHSRPRTSKTPITAWRELSFDEASEALPAARDMLKEMNAKIEASVADSGLIEMTITIDESVYPNVLQVLDAYLTKIKGVVGVVINPPDEKYHSGGHIPITSSSRPPQPGVYKVFVNNSDVLAGWAKWNGYDWFSIQQSKDEALRSAITRPTVEAPITRWERWF